MKTIEEAREMLEELGTLQEKGQATGLPCPRCGHDRMLPKPITKRTQPPGKGLHLP